MKVYCGIDWAERHHDIALVDENGSLVAKKRIHETIDGFAQLLDMLAAAGDNADEPIPVAIETPRGLLVAALRTTGRPIYPINPMAVARYRERHTVSGRKSDHADAMVLANILRTDGQAYRQLPTDSDLAPVDRGVGPRAAGRDLAPHGRLQRTALAVVRVQRATAFERPQTVHLQLSDEVIYLITGQAGHNLYARRPVRAELVSPHNPAAQPATGRRVHMRHITSRSSHSAAGNRRLTRSM